ncbi:MAG: hypothetical protein JRN23_04300 [Nitrososphaerota archaeon]|nr:hypothetical protein [Nitrososphaerota archaeon]
MKPRRFTRQGSEKISIVAFRYDRPTSIGYVVVSEPETVAKQVLRFLGEPNFADVISIRRAYLNEPENQPGSVQVERPEENETL